MIFFTFLYLIKLNIYFTQSFDYLFDGLTFVVSELNESIVHDSTSLFLNYVDSVTIADNTMLLLMFGLVACAKHWQYSFQAPHNDSMFWVIDLHADIMIFLIFVVGLVFALILGIIYPYYRTKTTTVNVTLSQESYSYVEHVDLKLHNHNSFYEMIWTILPILLELFIILPSFIVHYAVSQTHPYFMENQGITTANTVRVIGNQWYWIYQLASISNLSDVSVRGPLPITVIESYLVDAEDNILTLGLRMLEVDQPLHLKAGSYYKILITSDDVLHSWAIPSLNVKMDACPGRLNDVNLQIKDAGIYYGQCSELCGYYHGNMPIVLVAH